MKDMVLVRIATVCPETKVGDPAFNADRIYEIIDANRGNQIFLFPELCLTGYTCADLFLQTTLLDAAKSALISLDFRLASFDGVVVIGLPLMFEGSLYNCAVLMTKNGIQVVVPKSYLPNYKEFYERRWFTPAFSLKRGLTIELGDKLIPFGTDILFKDYRTEVVIGIEICEDLRTVIPPSCVQTLAGANIILNPSASNELVGKSAYRRELVVGQSGRCMSAYVYASCGPTESTTDVVFGGHCLIAENGSLLAESKKFERSSITVADIDLEKLMMDRARTSSFADTATKHASEFRTINFQLPARRVNDLARKVNALPFVPAGPELLERCMEIFNIQTMGLAKRLESANIKSMTIGVSGGLDSTLALLVAAKACDIAGKPRDTILGITMPGFGTTNRTLDNARKIMTDLGIRQKTIDIRVASYAAFRDIGHKPFGIDLALAGTSFEDQIRTLGKNGLPADLVFENVQARLRTFYLMSHGFVVGTGDMSELFLGWATYNGDHMSMYNPNCSVPKTLVRCLVEYIAHNWAGIAGVDYFGANRTAIRESLMDICATPISPELLPVDADGKATQPTEDIVGPYEMHDFFLFCMIRCGYGPKKTLYYANHADFKKKYGRDEIKKWLELCYKRFFQNQFKRSCVPDGPKVGSVSLSPRGDWRMPSDASVEAWLNELREN